MSHIVAQYWNKIFHINDRHICKIPPDTNARLKLPAKKEYIIPRYFCAFAFTCRYFMMLPGANKFAPLQKVVNFKSRHLGIEGAKTSCNSSNTWKITSVYLVTPSNRSSDIPEDARIKVDRPSQRLGERDSRFHNETQNSQIVPTFLHFFRLSIPCIGTLLKITSQFDVEARWWHERTWGWK